MLETPLGELLEVVIDHRGKTPKKLGGDFTTSGVPVVSAIHIKNGVIQWSERERYVSPDMFAKWMPIRLAKGDVLLTSEAPLGETALVPSNEDLVLSQRLIALRGKEGILDSRYLRYFLASRVGQARLHERATGTTVVGIRQAELMKVLVPVPTIEEQRRIAGVLEALDELVSVNRGLVQDLDEALKASWRSEAQDSSMSVQIGEIAQISKGLSYKGAYLRDHGLPMINMGCFGLDGAFRESGLKWYAEEEVRPKSRLEKGDLVVVNTDLTHSRDILARPVINPYSNATSTHHTYQVRVPNGEAQRFWLYCALREEPVRQRLISYATGTTVTALPLDALTSQEITWADTDRISAWWDQAEALYASQLELRKEITDLERTRDELITLMLSGRIRVGAGIAA